MLHIVCSLDTTLHIAEWEEFDLSALDFLRISILGLRPSYPRKGTPVIVRRSGSLLSVSL